MIRFSVTWRDLLQGGLDLPTERGLWLEHLKNSTLPTELVGGRPVCTHESF